MTTGKLRTWVGLVLCVGALWSAHGIAEEGVPVTTPSRWEAAGDRLSKNFTALMGQAWSGTKTFFKRVVIYPIAWGATAFFLGVFGGVCLYEWIRRRGWIELPFAWYRWVRWLWLVMLMFCISVGSAYAVVWWRTGAALKKYVMVERIVDRVAVNLACAVWLDAAAYEVKGNETAAEWRRVLEDSENTLSGSAELSKQVKKLAGLRWDHPAVGWLWRRAGEAWRKESCTELTRLGREDILELLVGKRPLDEYLKNGAHPHLAELATALATLRVQTVLFIDSMVYPNVLGGLLFAFGLPVMALGLFQALRRWCRPRPPLIPR